MKVALSGGLYVVGWLLKGAALPFLAFGEAMVWGATPFVRASRWCFERARRLNPYLWQRDATRSPSSGADR